MWFEEGPERCLEKVKGVLKEAELHFYEDEDKHHLLVPFQSESGTANTLFDTSEPGLTVCLTMLGINAPEEHRGRVSEFLTRANYGMKVGGFQFDYDDGFICFRASFCHGGGRLTAEMIRRLLDVNTAATDRYLPGIMSVIHDGVSPAEAVAKAETDDAEPEAACPVPKEREWN